MKRSYPLTRVGAIAFSLLLVLTLFPLNAQTAFATDAVKGVEVHADSSKLEASVAAAKAAGVDVQKEDDVDKGTTESASELTAKKLRLKRTTTSRLQILRQPLKKPRQSLMSMQPRRLPTILPKPSMILIKLLMIRPKQSMTPIL